MSGYGHKSVWATHWDSRTGETVVECLLCNQRIERGEDGAYRHECPRSATPDTPITTKGTSE